MAAILDMSADHAQSCAAPLDSAAKHKKNPIGSWFVKKFGRRNSEVGQASPSGPPSPMTAKDFRGRGTGNAQTPSHVSQLRPASGLRSFAGDSGQGLTNTLVVPTSASATNINTPPPQLASLPQQEPLGAMEFGPSDTASHPSPLVSTVPAPPIATAQPLSLQTDPKPNGLASSSEIVTPRASSNELPTAPQLDSSTDSAAIPAASSNGLGSSALPAADSGHHGPRRSSSESEGSSRDGEGMGRDSIGNRTMDTGKSRASTKPTTLMSLDTREAQVLPTTHIAQSRHGEGASTTQGAGAGSTSSAVQFASPPLARIGSGTRRNGGFSEEHGPYVNVPSLSRHHPSNNPSPFAQPNDNASVLTLASSTAAHSFAAAANSRSQGHGHAPSFGGARSTGGSFTGDRRNSSDTYASLKALPPLSRRGSDSSSRTRESVAASATGQSSAQAMYGATGAYAEPGPPSDRVSIHRTPSQRTVATQRSIPLSAPASNPALNAYSSAKSEQPLGSPAAGQESGAAAGSTLHREPQVTALADNDAAALDSVGSTTHALEALPTTEAVAQEVKAPPSPSVGLLETQAANLAANEHDVPSFFSKPQPVDDADKLHLPGGPAISL